MNKNIYIWGAILLVAAALRLYGLGAVPKGITNDELGYIANAYTIAHTGRNVFGDWFPVFTYFGPGFPFMPVPTYLQSIIFLVFPFTPLSGRLLNALLGIASVYLVGVLVKRLSGKDALAYAAGLALAISPWHIFFTRTAYDAVVASFFYLLFIVSVARKRGFAWWSFLWLFLALFSYRGMTPMAIGLVLLVFWYKKSIRVLLVGFCVLAIFFGVAYAQKSRGFISEGVQGVTVAENIELEMRATQGPQWLKRIYLNKPMSIASRFAEQYIGGLDPGVLFLHGEGSQTYSMWMRGRWYVVDALCILLGVLFLFRTISLVSFGIFSVGLFILSAIPGGVGGAPYGSRNFFMTIPAAMLVGAGWVWATQRKKLRIVVVCILVVLYSYAASHFLFDYFARYADQRSEIWFGSIQNVTRVIDSQKSDRQIVWANVGYFDFLQYAMYEHLSSQEIQGVRTAHQGDTFHFRNIIFQKLCTQEFLKTQKDRPLFILRDGCWKDMEDGTRINDFFGNAIWHIYETL